MTKNHIVVVTIEENPQLTLEELINAIHTTPELIQELIEYGILEPEGHSQTTWHFNSEQLRRAKKALRLQQDLEINLAGVALILDLMEQMEEMRAQVEMFHKHFKF